VKYPERIIKAKKDIIRADVICLIMDAQEFPTRQDSAIAHLSHGSGKPLLIALNKWDLIQKNTNTSKDFKQKVYEKLGEESHKNSRCFRTGLR
jgi:GTP-binding protein